MVGRNLDQQYPKVPSERGEEALRVEGLYREGVFHDVSFTAYAGEILGIAGLVGAGRTELMRAVFGADPITGRVYIFGKEIRVESPQQAIRAGVGLLPRIASSRAWSSCYRCSTTSAWPAWTGSRATCCSDG